MSVCFIYHLNSYYHFFFFFVCLTKMSDFISKMLFCSARVHLILILLICHRLCPKAGMYAKEFSTSEIVQEHIPITEALFKWIKYETGIVIGKFI